jgi:hypothetical protein
MSLLDADDLELLERFVQAAIPRSEWTHRVHVRIAYIHLALHPFDEALCLIRQRIRALNAANEVEEGPTSGYNETTTVAFLRLVATTMAVYRNEIPTANSNAFCDAHSQLMTRSVLRLFYSPARRMEPQAKFSFVEPDLSGLPQVPTQKPT